MRRTSLVYAALGLACAAASAPAEPPAYAKIAGSRFESVLPASPRTKFVEVKDFELQRLPVTNAQFQRFVRASPTWAPGKAAALYVDAGYLRHWQPGGPAAADSNRPVVNVSWFAANAYCEAQGARLPSWHEWEWASAANDRAVDARQDPAWRQRILGWYSETGGKTLGLVGKGKPDVHGVHDLHGLVWEWVLDYGALMVSGDNREQGDPDLMKFCGTGALSMEQKDNYAVLMRIAMLSSLQARDTTNSLGFRCAKDVK